MTPPPPTDAQQQLSRVSVRQWHRVRTETPSSSLLSMEAETDMLMGLAMKIDRANGLDMRTMM